MRHSLPDLALLLLVSHGVACTPQQETSFVDSAGTDAGLTDDKSRDACNGNPGIGTLPQHSVSRFARVDRFPASNVDLSLTVDAAAPYDIVEAFACVPLRSDGYGSGPRYERVALPLASETTYDSLFATRLTVADRHLISPPPYSPGAYFGVQTPLGIVWAQGPGNDVSFGLQPRRGQTP